MNRRHAIKSILALPFIAKRIVTVKTCECGGTGFMLLGKTEGGGTVYLLCEIHKPKPVYILKARDRSGAWYPFPVKAWLET